MLPYELVKPMNALSVEATLLNWACTNMVTFYMATLALNFGGIKYYFCNTTMQNSEITFPSIETT